MRMRGIAGVVCLAIFLPTFSSANPRKSSRARPRPTPEPTKPANRPPEWPADFRIETKSELKYDEKQPGRSLGATTTILVLTPATDPDEDPLFYRWSGTGVGATTGGLKNFDIEEADLRGNGLSATWWRQNWSGEPASGILMLTADDGKGGVARQAICIGPLVRCP